MKKLIVLILFLSVFSLTAIEIDKEDLVHCEPSLIFPSVFALDDPICFSYIAVLDLSEDNGKLNAYLESHSDDTHQHYFRLSYYLRDRNFFVALVTFIHMVNIGAADPSAMIYEQEFSNIIAGGIKHSRDSKNKSFGQRDPGKMMSMDEFSTNFFAVISYLASQDKTPPDSKEDTDLKILSMSFQYVFSNFFNGIDLEKDSYSKDLFNRLIKLKNAKLLKKYLQFFFYFSKKGGTVPEYRDYVSLKDLTAIKGFDMHIGNRIAAERMKRIFASFYLDNIEKMSQIEYSADFSGQHIQDTGREVCDYLVKREKWLKTLEVKDPDDIKYNESIKIVENCPGSFELPFIILENKIVVEKKHSWMVDIAVALKYLSQNDMDQKKAESILNGAVRSSLSKSYGSKASQFADLLTFFYYTDRSSDLLFALYSKQIGFLKKDVSDPENWAADFLSTSLF